MFKKITIIFTIIIIFIFVLLPKNTYADDWVLQVSDPKDSRISSDFKNIYMKEDSENIFIKCESYTDWNLREDELLMAVLNINNAIFSDSSYLIAVGCIEGSYIGLFMYRETGEFKDMYVNFENGSSNGEMTIPKSYADNKFKNFYFSFAITNDNEVFDICPNDESLQKYQKGPSSAKPKLNTSTPSLTLKSVVAGENIVGEFEVINDGGGILDVKMSPSLNNISLSPSQVSIEAYDSTNIELRVNTFSLEPRTYSESINISSNGGNMTVNVYFEIYKNPELIIENDIIDFGKVMSGERKSENITIGNKNRGPIKVKIISDSDWLLVNNDSFTSDSESIKVTVTTKKLTEGEYNGLLKITSNGGKGEISIKMVVIKPLSIDKNQIDFGKIYTDNLKVDQQKLILTNNSSDTLSVKVKSDSDWIKFDKFNISILSEENKELNVDIDFSKFDEESKIYSGKITLEYGTEITEIEVKIEIVQIPPKMTINTEEDTAEITEIKTSVKIGDVFEKKIKITNTGSGILKVKVSISDENSPIQLNKRNIILKQNDTVDLILTIDYKDVKPGDYSTVLILDSNVEKREIPINVTFINPEILIKLYIGSPVAFIGEKNVMLDSPPFIEKGTTMVPLRFVGEAFGADVQWQNIGKGRVVIKIKNKNIILDIGSNIAYINDESKQLLAPPVIKNGRTFVPVRFISEGLGAEVGWDSVKQEISIKYNPVQII